MTEIHITDILESNAKRGNRKFWQGVVGTDGTSYFTYTRFWQELSDGINSVVQQSEPTLIAGKNLGRANETTPRDQAIFEITSLYNKYIDKGYHKEGEISTVLTLPMLAHKYPEKLKHVKFPCHVQKKLDGCRCLSDGEKMWSRGGKLFITSCVEHLLFDTSGYTLDGELILPQPYTFQDSIKAVKKFNRTTTHLLTYHVYDVVEPDMGYGERYKLLRKLCENAPENVIVINSRIVYSHEEIEKNLKRYIENGWEGAIVRDMDAGYEINTRSNSLLKYKIREDAEFVIVDVISGEKGKEVNAAMYVCVTPEGKEFTARPTGTIEDRKVIYENRKRYIGKIITVEFLGYTDDGKPRHGVAKNFRDKDLQG